MHDGYERLQSLGQVDRDNKGVVTLGEAIIAHNGACAAADTRWFPDAAVRLPGHGTTSSPQRRAQCCA